MNKNPNKLLAEFLPKTESILTNLSILQYLVFVFIEILDNDINVKYEAGDISNEQYIIRNEQVRLWIQKTNALINA